MESVPSAVAQSLASPEASWGGSTPCTGAPTMPRASSRRCTFQAFSMHGPALVLRAPQNLPPQPAGSCQALHQPPLLTAPWTRPTRMFPGLCHNAPRRRAAEPLRRGQPQRCRHPAMPRPRDLSARLRGAWMLPCYSNGPSYSCSREHLGAGPNQLIFSQTQGFAGQEEAVGGQGRT